MSGGGGESIDPRQTESLLRVLEREQVLPSGAVSFLEYDDVRRLCEGSAVARRRLCGEFGVTEELDALFEETVRDVDRSVLPPVDTWLSALLLPRIAQRDAMMLHNHWRSRLERDYGLATRDVNYAASAETGRHVCAQVRQWASVALDVCEMYLLEAYSRAAQRWFERRRFPRSLRAYAQRMVALVQIGDGRFYPLQRRTRVAFVAYREMHEQSLLRYRDFRQPLGLETLLYVDKDLCIVNVLTECDGSAWRGASGEFVVHTLALPTVLVAFAHANTLPTHTLADLSTALIDEEEDDRQLNVHLWRAFGELKRDDQSGEQVVLLEDDLLFTDHDLALRADQLIVVPSVASAVPSFLLGSTSSAFFAALACTTARLLSARADGEGSDFEFPAHWFQYNVFAQQAPVERQEEYGDNDDKHLVRLLLYGSTPNAVFRSDGNIPQTHAYVTSLARPWTVRDTEPIEWPLLELRNVVGRFNWDLVERLQYYAVLAALDNELLVQINGSLDFLYTGDLRKQLADEAYAEDFAFNVFTSAPVIVLDNQTMRLWHRASAVSISPRNGARRIEMVCNTNESNRTAVLSIDLTSSEVHVRLRVLRLMLGKTYVVGSTLMHTGYDDDVSYELQLVAVRLNTLFAAEQRIELDVTADDAELSLVPSRVTVDGARAGSCSHRLLQNIETRLNNVVFDDAELFRLDSHVGTSKRRL